MIKDLFSHGRGTQCVWFLEAVIPGFKIGEKNTQGEMIKNDGTEAEGTCQSCKRSRGSGFV